MTTKKTFTILVCIVVIMLIAIGAVKFKGYYNNRYVASDVYYTQIPEDINYEDSWLYNADGEKEEQGYAYELIAYNAEGDERAIYFSMAGTADELYSPRTYLEVKTSTTIVLGHSAVEESKVPHKALENIKSLGDDIKSN